MSLPAEGRSGDAPEWPLTDPFPRELELWASLWRKPQALMWERFGLEFEVALYCRRFAEAERPRASTILGTLVRQMADSLGLTTPGMRSNRWRIDRIEEPKARPARRQSSRSRLTVVGDDAGA